MSSLKKVDQVHFAAQILWIIKDKKWNERLNGIKYEIKSNVEESMKWNDQWKKKKTQDFILIMW